MNNISILGLGNISYELCLSLIKQGFNVFGTTDNPDRKKILKKLGVKIFNRNQLNNCIQIADKIIITIPPSRRFAEVFTKSNTTVSDVLSCREKIGNNKPANIIPNINNSSNKRKP